MIYFKITFLELTNQDHTKIHDLDSSFVQVKNL
jgi:hypothetical protein